MCDLSKYAVNDYTKGGKIFLNKSDAPPPNGGEKITLRERWAERQQRREDRKRMEEIEESKIHEISSAVVLQYMEKAGLKNPEVKRMNNFNYISFVYNGMKAGLAIVNPTIVRFDVPGKAYKEIQANHEIMFTGKDLPIILTLIKGELDIYSNSNIW